MKKILTLISTGFILFTSFSAQDLPSVLQHKLEELQQNEDVYGVSGAVLLDGELIWNGTAGYSNPFTLDTITTDMTASIGSNTKMFTSVIILQLVEEGKLSLDQTIDNWLTPSDKIPGIVTVRQLLNHTSGIADYTTQEWIDSFKVNPGRVWTTEEIIDRFVNEPNFQPGTSWKYSNTGYFLLGEIIEEIEGKPYREVLYERIFIPHELSSMYTPIEDVPTGPQMIPWIDFDQSGNRINLFENGSMMAMHTSAWAAGYIYSKPVDLAKFLHELFNKNMLSKEELDEMKTTVSARSNYDYGLGLVKYKIFDTPFYGHTGQYIGYLAYSAYEEETKLSVALLLNVTNADIYGMGQEITEIAYNYFLTGVNENEPVAYNFELFQNYPNPFNPSTTISFSIPKESHITLKIFDVLGREIMELINDEKSAGVHKINFEASNLAGGIYFYTLQTDKAIVSKKMLLIK